MATVWTRRGRRTGDRPTAHLIGVLCLVALLVPLTGPPGDAAHPTWEQPQHGDGSALLALQQMPSGALWSVGHHGRILRGDGTEWVDVPTPTDRHLHAVSFASDMKGLAVGERGIILDYGPHWGPYGAYPSGTDSADGSTGTGASMERHIEFKLPLDVIGIGIGIGPGTVFGLGVMANGTGAWQAHPPDMDRERPHTSDRIRFDDVVRGTPTIDGTAEAMWAPAVHAEHPSGAVPFSLHLLRDVSALYVLVAGGADLTGATLQLHRTYGEDASVGDTRFRHPVDATAGSDGPEHAVTGAADWAVHRAMDALTPQDLHGVTWLDASTPLVVGAAGTALVREEGIWRPLATGTTSTLFGVDARDGTAYAVGAAPDRKSGAVLVKMDPTGVTRPTLPGGTYGLSAIDLDACLATGSAGTLLGCDAGDPSRWVRTVVDPATDLHALTHDVSSGTTWLAGGTTNAGASLYESTAEGWSPRHLPVPEGILGAVLSAKGALHLAALDGDLHLLSRHVPTFDEVPQDLTARQGEMLHFRIRGVDRDNDILFLDLHKRPGLPYPEGIVKTDEGDGNWSIDWLPPFDAPPQVGLDVHLSDGKDGSTEGIGIIIIDANGPPYWDPHPDAAIAHSIPWTTYVKARDPDNDPLTLHAVTLPGGATFTDLGDGLGRIDWTPSAGQLGTHPVTLDASDGALDARLTFNVTVVTNRPPIIDSTSPKDPTLCVKGPWWHGTLTLSARAHDPDGTDVTYTWTFHDDGTTATGAKVQHTYEDPGTEYVTLTVTDGHGVQNSTTLVVRVDDCIHVEAELDDPCIAPALSTASGRLTLHDHTGQITTGEYAIAVAWGATHGPRQRIEFGGTVDGPNVTFRIPHDLTPLPLNELWRHDVYVTGLKHDTLFGDTERHTVPLFYDVSPLCDLPRIPGT